MCNGFDNLSQRYLIGKNNYLQKLNDYLLYTLSNITFCLSLNVSMVTDCGMTTWVLLHPGTSVGCR